ncbi:hypothetical protein C8R44DRAFT_741055 [Mycena epipterygia]|nr:hypothetical protein C8R44DRAFT_741055 [Mycena epipterygia]
MARLRRKKEKKIRGRKSKMDTEQTAWLEERYARLLVKQRRGTLPKFWVEMEADWFKVWPEEDELHIEMIPNPEDPDGELMMSPEDTIALGKSTTKRKKQLHAWFNNRNQKMKKTQDGVDGGGDTSGKLAAQLFNGLDKKSRRWQHVEIWQKRNKARFEAAVQAALRKMAKKKGPADDDGNASDNSDSDTSSSSDDDSDSDSDATSDTNSNAGGRAKGKVRRETEARVKMDNKARSVGMSVKRKVACEMWEAETGEEREAVLKMYDEQEVPGSKENAFGKIAEERTPEELQDAIDELDGILAEFHAGIKRVTGWVGVTLLGGPMPEEGGRIMTKAIYSGLSPAGLSLSQSVADWETTLTASGQFFKRCFSREVRRSYALPSKDLTDSSPGAPTAPAAPSPSPTSSKKKAKRPENKAPAKVAKKRPPKQAATAARAAKAATDPNPPVSVAPTRGDWPSDDTALGDDDGYLGGDLGMGDLSDFDLGPLGEIGSGEIPDWLTAYVPSDPALLDTAPSVPTPVPDLVLDQSTAALVPPPAQRPTPRASYKGATHAPTDIAPAHIGWAATSVGGGYPAFTFPPPPPSTTFTPTRGFIRASIGTPTAPPVTSTPTSTPPSGSFPSTTSTPAIPLTSAYTPPPAFGSPVTAISTTARRSPSSGPHIAASSAPDIHGTAAASASNAPAITPVLTEASTATSRFLASSAFVSSSSGHRVPQASTTSTLASSTATLTPPAHSASTSSTEASTATGSLASCSTIPARHQRRLTSLTPPRLRPPTAPAPAPVHVLAPLTAFLFPELRPMSNAPLEPRLPTTRGRGRPRGARRRGGGRGGGSRAAPKEGEFLQTYDDTGNVVPLPLDTQTTLSWQRRKELLALSKKGTGEEASSEPRDANTGIARAVKVGPGDREGGLRDAKALGRQGEERKRSARREQGAASQEKGTEKRYRAGRECWEGWAAGNRVGRQDIWIARAAAEGGSRGRGGGGRRRTRKVESWVLEGGGEAQPRGWGAGARRVAGVQATMVNGKRMTPLPLWIQRWAPAGARRRRGSAGVASSSRPVGTGGEGDRGRRGPGGAVAELQTDKPCRGHEAQEAAARGAGSGGAWRGAGIHPAVGGGIRREPTGGNIEKHPTMEVGGECKQEEQGNERGKVEGEDKQGSIPSNRSNAAAPPELR